MTIPLSPSRRRQRENNENVFINVSLEQPPPKRTHCTLPKDDDPALIAAHRKAVDERSKRETVRVQEEADRIAARDMARLQAAVTAVREDHGFKLNNFITALLQTKDPYLSSEMTKLIKRYGPQHLASMRDRCPDVIDEFAVEATLEIIKAEGKKLSALLTPSAAPLHSRLWEWSLQDITEKAKEVAPTIYRVLRAASEHEKQGTKRRDRDLVFTTAVCMLAQAHNKRANMTQSMLCIYLIACGAFRSQFKVLHHAGITSSYSKALLDIKQLRDERLWEIVKIARSRAFMIIWDNLNFAFRFSEQRHDSKDHFDNGTTATLIPLYDVAFGELSLSMLPPRRTRLHVLDFSPEDFLPAPSQIQQLEEALLWHIEDILFEAFLTLRTRFRDQIQPPPLVDAIPLHKTEQYPLPAMHIDESSLDGTLDVVKTIIQQVLEMKESNVQSHGIIFCDGDQLSNSLLDKSGASRRDDDDLLNNVSRYTKSQMGLFHVKLASTRMCVNEHWGTPNSKAPWLLWRANTLLGRKPTSVGWKAKKLAPFRPSWELMLKLTLPANILDAIRLSCGSSSLETWVTKVKTFKDLREVTCRVRDHWCSSQRVATLRKLSKRDVTLENIILFNRDALLLREFAHSIKRGDIGSDINVLSWWSCAFRGTSAMPKYSDAVFETLVELKQMEPPLRCAFVNNWLANLSGLANGFKEMDLLQEHQNFWAKACVIYCARGVNRSWKWLSMITVIIFILQDVIRSVQASFKTPYNGKSHTSPSTEADIRELRKYLQEQHIQTYRAFREGGSSAVPVRDLFIEGAKYPNTASAFKNFKPVVSKASYKPADDTGDDLPLDVEDRGNDENDAEEDNEISMEDLPEDDEDFFLPGMDLADTITQVEEMMQMLERYD